MAHNDLVGQLHSLLEDEKRLLLEGELEELDQLGNRKADLFQKVAEDVTDIKALKRMQDQLKRNEVLYDQALKGIKAVADRLSEFQRLRSSLDTYDAHGRKTRLGGWDRTKVERRA